MRSATVVVSSSAGAALLPSSLGKLICTHSRIHTSAQILTFIHRVGDVLDTLLSLMVFRTATKVEDGLPPVVVVRMLINIIFDFVIGIVPFIGDLADAAFRANTRNAAILEAHLREKGKKSLRKSGMPLPDVDPSLGEEYDRLQRGDAGEFVSEQPRRNERMRDGNGRSGTAPVRPEPARTKRNGGSRGLSGRVREPDLEMGQVDRQPTPSKSKSKKQRRS